VKRSGMMEEEVCVQLRLDDDVRDFKDFQPLRHLRGETPSVKEI
jgi:hypothetical protein